MYMELVLLFGARVYLPIEAYVDLPPEAHAVTRARFLSRKSGIVRAYMARRRAS